MKHLFFVVCILLCAVLTNNSLLFAEIINGDFEQAVPGDDFRTPYGWNVENYAAVLSTFIPQPPRGSTINWKIDVETGLAPFEGDSFVVLSNGMISPETTHAKIWQDVSLEVGDVVSGAYFFGTCDYIPYGDYATISLVAKPGSELADIELVNITTGDVGSYGSTDGWVPFQSVPFTEATAGTYTLEFVVTDMVDNIFNSYLAVDGLIPEPSTLLLFSFGGLILRKRK